MSASRREFLILAPLSRSGSYSTLQPVRIKQVNSRDSPDSHPKEALRLTLAFYNNRCKYNIDSISRLDSTVELPDQKQGSMERHSENPRLGACPSTANRSERTWHNEYRCTQIRGAERALFDEDLRAYEPSWRFRSRFISTRTGS